MNLAAKKRACLAACAIALLSVLPALDGGNVPLAPRPSWVKPVELDASSGIDTSLVDSGFYYILNDQQQSVSPVAHYRHFAFKVINHSGLEEASRIEIPYESAYETLSLHGFRVWRGGKAIDWSKRVRWQELQREAALNVGLYDESKTMLLILEDIRQDDVIEYDYTVEGANPIFGEKYSGDFHYGLDYPMATLSFRLLIPANRDIAIKQHVREISPIETALADGTREIVWSERNSPAVREDYATPGWYEQYPWIEMSEWKSWTEVKEWGRSIFGEAEGQGDGVERAWKQVLDAAPVREEPSLETKADGVGERESGAARARAKAAPEPNRNERLTVALRFVQDEIRYFGIEIGVNSHRPRAPEEVLEGRFGDCKDKALLFCRMARLAGWEASPALVNSTEGRSLDDWLPSPSAFDHVIAAVRGPWGLMWFDPTISYQGGPIADVWVPDYGKALVLDGSKAGLQAMPTEKSGSLDVHETYAAPGYDKPGTLEVVSVFRGHEADRMRYQLANTGRATLEKNYLEFYQASFPKAERALDITSADDREANALELHESYALPEMWRKGADSGEDTDSNDAKRELYVFPYAFSKRFTDFDDIGTERSAPLDLSFNCRARHRITVVLPENLGINAEEYKSANPWYRLEYRAREDGKTFELDYAYEPLVETVKATDFGAFRTKLESDRKAYLGYTLRGGIPESAATDAPEPRAPLSGIDYAAAALLVALTALIAYRLGLIHGRARRDDTAETSDSSDHPE